MDDAAKRWGLQILCTMPATGLSARAAHCRLPLSFSDELVYGTVAQTGSQPFIESLLQVLRSLPSALQNPAWTGSRPTLNQ
jgi:hypothetical protein